MPRTNHLLRVLGLAFGLAAVVGAVIGQGILRAPSIVAEASGSPALLIGLWALGAGIAAISAFAFAELGAAIPCAGGPMAFIERAFGRTGGVIAAFALLIMLVSSEAVIVFVLGEFLVRLGIGGGSVTPGTLGIATLAVFAIVNATGTRASGGLQIGLSSIKAVVLLGLVIVLFAQPGLETVADAPAQRAGGWIGYGTAMLVIIGTYNGWGDVVVYGEEIENPQRAIPRALFGGIAVVATIYLLVNLALLHVMSPAALAGSDFAAADAAKGVFGDSGDLVFTAFGVLSVGAIANLALMTTTRIAYAMAREGMLPPLLARVSRLGTPIPAMLCVALAVAAFLLSGTYLTLSATSVSLSQAIILGVIVAVVALRRKEPALERPFRVPFYPWPIVIAVAINLALLVVFVIQDPVNALLGFGLVAALSAGYLLLARRRAPIAVAETGAETWPSPS